MFTVKQEKKKNPWMQQSVSVGDIYVAQSNFAQARGLYWWVKVGKNVHN